MSLLITGAGGQLGQDIAKACQIQGIPFIAADSKTLDITRSQDVTVFLKARPDIETIINCAAYNAVDEAEREWKKAFLVNGIGVRNLVHAANSCHATLVHFSSDYVFDGKLARPYTIIDQPHPLSWYGASKLLGEQVVRDLADRYFLIRVSWVFGRGNVNFAKKVIEWGRGKEELSIVADQVAAPTYTRDLAPAVLKLLSSGQYGLYHITNSGWCSRYDWARYILDKVGWNGRLVPAKSEDFTLPAKRPPFSVLDNFGSDEVLGYTLPSWQDATDRFLKELEMIP